MTLRLKGKANQRLAGSIKLLLLAAFFITIPASAYANYVTFYGHGYGHGAGLSMTGVYFLAKDEGWSYQKILTYYFSSTKWGKIDDESTIVAEGTDGVKRNIKMKEYLYRLAEEPDSWPREGLRTTMVAARTYAWEKMKSKGYVPKWGQAFNQNIDPDTRPNIVKAVNDTVGQILTYNGKPIIAAYSSSAGGYTAGLEDVFGGTGYAYLKPKKSTWDSRGKNYSWKKMVPFSDIQKAYPQIGKFKTMKIVKKSGYGDWGGRAVRVKLTGSKSSLELYGYTFASKLGLLSNYYTLSVKYIRTKLWQFSPQSTQTFSKSMIWDSGIGTWDWKKIKHESGDFNNDGKDDVVAMYGNYGSTRTKLWAFLSNGTKLAAPVQWWDSADSMWDWKKIKLSSGDYDGDGDDDLAAMYGNYGTARTKLWVFLSESGKLSKPKLWWDSSNSMWDWNKIKLISGDYDGDGDDDLAAMYGNYGTARTKLWVFWSETGKLSKPKMTWDSADSMWDWKKIKLASGDYDGDGDDELAAFYGNYGTKRVKLWVFLSDKGKLSRPKIWWDSSNSLWDWNKIKLSTGDVNGDNKDDLTVMYGNYGTTARTKLWVFLSENRKLAKPVAWWDSGAGHWSWSRIKFITGNFNSDSKDEIAAFYNSGTL